MKREDFTFTCSIGGYMLQYKGQNIGGAGTLSGGRNLRGNQKQRQVEDYKRQAESEINHILSGQLGRYKEAIDKIDSL